MSQEQNNKRKSLVERVKTEGTTGDVAAYGIVVIDDTAYGVSKELMDTVTALPDCNKERCAKIQEKINRACADRKWPPGTPFLLCTDDAHCCNCYCR